MKPYTVLLLYPDYLADNYGEETCQAWVMAESAIDASGKATLKAAAAYPTVDNPFDFLTLAVYEGHHHNLWEI